MTNAIHRETVRQLLMLNALGPATIYIGIQPRNVDHAWPIQEKKEASSPHTEILQPGGSLFAI